MRVLRGTGTVITSEDVQGLVTQSEYERAKRKDIHVSKTYKTTQLRI